MWSGWDGGRGGWMLTEDSVYFSVRPPRGWKMNWKKGIVASNAEQGDSQDDSDSEEADSETEETDNGRGVETRGRNHSFHDGMEYSWIFFKPGEWMRMMYYSVSDTGILGKRKSECSHQEATHLRPSDYKFGCSTTELQETRGS